MSGLPWFRLYNEMMDDPKIGTLSDAEFRTWIQLLCAASKHDQEGDTGLTEENIDWFCRRTVTVTLQALLQRKLVRVNSAGNIIVCNFSKRNPRSDNSLNRVRKYRENKKKLDINTDVTACNGGNAVTVTAQDRDIDNNINLSSLRSDRFIPPSDEKIKHIGEFEQKPETQLTTEPIPTESIFITIPLNDKTEFPITQKQITDWHELYPGVDIEQQLRSYKGWALANPTKRKTKRGILKSINTWLAKEQDRGGNIIPFKQGGLYEGSQGFYQRPKSKVDVFEEVFRANCIDGEYVQIN